MRCKQAVIAMMRGGGVDNDEVVDHARGCAECGGTSDLIRELREEGEGMRALDMSLQSQRETRRMVASILSEKADGASVFHVPVLYRWRIAGGLAAVAACVVLLMSIDRHPSRLPDAMHDGSASAEALSKRIADVRRRVSHGAQRRRQNQFDYKIGDIRTRVHARAFQLKRELQG